MTQLLPELGGPISPQMITVSRPELLVDGSDATYRVGVHALMAVSNNIEEIRRGFGTHIGISGPQHEMLMLIARMNDGKGISVGEIAKLIKRTHVFVASETNRLQAMALVQKNPLESDRRVSVVTVTDQGNAALLKLSELQREVNDLLFGNFSRVDFLSFITLIQKLVMSSETALQAINNK
ncbi:transcriptional regulator [Pseudomonas amygdali pv. eriobotryae]|uniref:Regulatory protein n=1 Tax=Pseudomonas amygdali pv. eriobotryae TaxID=129137 RepID=A0A0P9QPY4_PSEA0|nr:MarR family winged helix-turn-helix transcriptional regulator [Pseudomonas amygdali]KPX26769.1 Regulatory protein [Pseudomonas amygdali pv. eriobotryae]KWS72915.1 hypothetical protein AL052_15050 [Pseudomonas amygdali pv. eriobotryae]RMM00320.1 Regulatory protein [Pseudomonas amygdali pv. eriobotryae]RMO51012.1 Regulatory protein [Pseudomonas amygdali pv. eriobotryae]GFZ62811.1 transcriptional regulator [Pseudomonas amygdali pv. eriobotryae]